MNLITNLKTRANKQVNKQLYQSQGEVGTTFKGKPDCKKQTEKANIIPGIPDGETIDTLQEQ